jgi:hypothetical protein
MHGEVADRLSSKGWAKPIVHKQMPFDDNETPVAYAAHAEDDPLLTTAQTADVLEGDERGVMAMVRSNQLPYETEAHGKRIFYRFRQSAAEAAKPLYRRLRDFQEKGFHQHPERGKEYTLSKAAEKHELALYQLRQAAKNGELPCDELEPPPSGARPWIIVTEKNLLLFLTTLRRKKQAGQRVNRDRWKLITQVQEAIGVDNPQERADVSACAKCWCSLGWLETKEVTVRQLGKVPSHWKLNGQGRSFDGLREVERTRTLVTYDWPQFKKLWDKDFTRDGARRIKELLNERADRCPARTIIKELHKLGIAGKGRRAQCVKAAHVKAIHDRGLGAKNQLVYVPRKAARRPNAVEIMRSLLPIPAGQGLRKGREAELTVPEIYEALEQLKVQLQPSKHVGPWEWRLPTNGTGTTERRKARRDSHPKPQDGLTKVEQAIQIFLRDPNQSIRAVAQKVPCAPSLLFKSDKFGRVVCTFKGSLPKGSKSVDGTLEAEDG